MKDDLPTIGERNANDRGDREVPPRLVHLADMHDLRVSQGDPDIRGWSVRMSGGDKVGVVTDLIVDTQLMTVRYIEAKIDREVLSAGADRHVLIPIASARLDDDKDDVFLNAAIVDPRSLTPYDRSMLSDASALPADVVQPLQGESDEQFFGQRRRGREDTRYITPLNDTPRRTNELP